MMCQGGEEGGGGGGGVMALKTFFLDGCDSVKSSVDMQGTGQDVIHSLMGCSTNGADRLKTL